MTPIPETRSNVGDFNLAFSNSVKAYMTRNPPARSKKMTTTKRKGQVQDMRAATQTIEGGAADQPQGGFGLEVQLDHDTTIQVRSEQYYVLATEAYLHGWSTHFHFAPFTLHQSLPEALAFSEHKLALMAGLRPGMKVLDVGCGVGAPAREIAKFIGCEIVGVSINQDHIDRAAYLTAQEGLSGLCTFVMADFMDLPFATSSFDAAYAIEATCHAPSLHKVYAEVARVLKPNAPFGLSEWVLTPKYDHSNAKHVQIRRTIEHGGGISMLNTAEDARKALHDARFEILHEEDYSRHWDAVLDFNCIDESTTSGLSSIVVPYKRGRAPLRRSKSGSETDLEGALDPDAPCWSPAPSPVHPPSYYSLPRPLLSQKATYKQKMSSLRPWYFPLRGKTHLTTTRDDHHLVFKMSTVPRKATYWLFRLLETLGLWPKGTREAMDVLRQCVDGCAEGGEEGIFSPSWWFICRNDKDRTSSREEEEAATHEH